MDDMTLMLIVGTVIAVLSLLLHIRKRFILSAKQRQEHRSLIKASGEREIQRQKQSGLPVKHKSGVSSNVLPKRIPLPDAVGTIFNGAYTPQNIAKWEVEIDQIGRSVSARIDMKMLALQTLTLEADRAASRLEILIGHLETLLKETQITPPPDEKQETPAEIQNIIQEEFREEVAAETMKKLPGTDIAVSPEISPEIPAAITGNLIRSSETENIQTKTYSEVFSQLENNHEYAESNAENTGAETFKEEPKPVKIIPEIMMQDNLPPLRTAQPPSETISPANIRIQTALSSQNYTVPFVKPSTKTAAKAEKHPYNALSLETLYNGSGTTSKNSGAVVRSNTISDTPPEPVLSPHLSLRSQAEVLAGSGYTANQIAQTLNITVGEVDLMLSLRRE